MKPIADILEDAARLIETKGWARGAMARAGNHRQVMFDDPRAKCFCISGAIRLVGGQQGYWTALDAVEEVIGAFPPEWNDKKRRTKAQVVAALRQAATLARGDTA